MHAYTLTPEDLAAIEPVVAELTKTYEEIEDPELIRRSRLLAARLPQPLLDFLEEFRIAEPDAICMISGLPVDEAALGATPTHWRNSHVGSPALAQELVFLLCGAALGDVFGWATQQGGRIIHDILPIQGDEHREIGSNSLQHLSWHIEDAFHPCRGDYVALMCLKNPDDVETVVGSGFDVDWSALDVATLFEPEFTVMPDNSHQPASANESSGDPAIDRLTARSFALIESWNTDPPPRPILFGDTKAPYMALDPYHMDSSGWSPRAKAAFTGLVDALEASLEPVALRPGELVFIDNFRAVHGRKSFVPRYDGSDRWLKRLNITRNLRGSRGWRLAPDHRIIY